MFWTDLFQQEMLRLVRELVICSVDKRGLTVVPIKSKHLHLFTYLQSIGITFQGTFKKGQFLERMTQEYTVQTYRSGGSCEVSTVYQHDHQH